jgi:hypothetical protein
MWTKESEPKVDRPLCVRGATDRQEALPGHRPEVLLRSGGLGRSFRVRRSPAAEAQPGQTEPMITEVKMGALGPELLTIVRGESR